MSGTCSISLAYMINGVLPCESIMARSSVPDLTLSFPILRPGIILTFTPLPLALAIVYLLDCVT